MGQVVNLYGANFTDSRLPILYNYPGLNPGSLFLLDAVMIDSDFNFSATGTTVYTDNLAAEVAAELTGKTAADLKVAWNNTLVTTGSAPEAKFERTAKGGIHGILSLVNQVSGHRGRFTCPGIMPYVAEHQHDHKFLLIMHYQVTRVGSGTPATQTTEVLISSQTSPSTNRLIVARLPNAVSAGPAQFSLQSDKNGSDFTENIYYQDMPVWGAASGFGALVNNNCKSFVMYRTHLIDIDASGMALADIVAAERQLFNANFNAGGKYAGDTIPTSPSALP
ncbi:hypothetical protein [Klebsiella pneumoniae]|uniref:hypothetical protein n=1 Tax=Klebsiella pneumoniae TaxID=573 RepID=UPI0007CC4853|nr:hypothetical protein [Klebsiella pneumoniae]SAW71795.1 Uncharacterised protein [Klebsiella pneumoniae]